MIPAANSHTIPLSYNRSDAESFKVIENIFRSSGRATFSAVMCRVALALACNYTVCDSHTKAPMTIRHDPFIPTRWSLISRLKDWDDRESWKNFFDTYWKLIYGAAIKAGLSDVEAEEVVQETVITEEAPGAARGSRSGRERRAGLSRETSGRCPGTERDQDSEKETDLTSESGHVLLVAKTLHEAHAAIRIPKPGASETRRDSARRCARGSQICHALPKEFPGDTVAARDNLSNKLCHPRFRTPRKSNTKVRSRRTRSLSNITTLTNSSKARR